jgi:hypothetical protein
MDPWFVGELAGTFVVGYAARLFGELRDDMRCHEITVVSEYSTTHTLRCVRSGGHQGPCRARYDRGADLFPTTHHWEPE